MLATVLIILGLVISAYVALRIWDARTLLDRSAFPEIFAGLEDMNLTGTFMFVIRFEGVRQWFILSREAHGDQSTMYLCLPRVGFSDDDYASLEKMFLAHSFEFRKEPEMSRFFARIPIDAADRDKRTSVIAAHAARLFMQALDIDPAVKFRRKYEAA